MAFLISVVAQLNTLSKPYFNILSGEHKVENALNADKDAIRGVFKITNLINNIAKERINFQPLPFPPSTFGILNSTEHA